MAGVRNPNLAPYPTGTSIFVRLGGYVHNGLTGATVDYWYAPFDCWVKSVRRTYIGGTAHLDALTLVTNDDSKTLVAAVANPSANIADVAQTLHADIVGYQIEAGDKILQQADSTDANEEGIFRDVIEIVPGPVGRQ
ncbi:MAG: hypothetical protein ACYSVY_12725 [Planctomycetota bacterium]|jgi:hypothetical protein